MKPLYMWAGGKTKLLKHYAPILPDVKQYDRFIEPFFGGGAVWAEIQKDFDKETVINDTNAELMGVLEAIRDNPEAFLKELHQLSDKYLVIEGKEARKEHYYRLREQYWDKQTAGLLYFLMRLGFNGLWQTCADSNGKFGTPAGLLNHKRKEQIFNEDLIRDWFETLQKTSVYKTSYESIDFDPKNALVYLDPPYRDSFTTYSTGFSDDDQRELVKWIKGIASQGATVLFANRCVEDDNFFEDLLPEAEFHYFDVTYTVGRRKKNENGSYSAKSAREFLAVIVGDGTPEYVPKQQSQKRGTLFA